MIETRKTEKKLITSDPKEIINKYLAKRVFKTWVENFVDEDSGEVVSIERHELLFERGTLVDKETLAQIMFFLNSGDITDVEVSNQRRMAIENENNSLYLYMSQARIGGKKYKFLLYATNLNNTISILKDYIELNYKSHFTLTMVKEFDYCVVITDKLKEFKIDDADMAYLKDEITMEDYVDKLSVNEEGVESKTEEKKFYQIEAKVTYNDEETTQTFIVHTFNVDRAMMLINFLLESEEEKYYNQAKEKGHEYDKREIHASVESAKPIPVEQFIPKEFSIAYME